MKAWFLSLTQRERNMVLSAATVIILFVFYGAVLDPIMTTHERNKKNVAAATATLEWMKSAANEVKKLRGGKLPIAKPTGKKFLLGIVDRGVRKSGLSGVMKRVQPEGDTGVRVWFEKAAFDKLIKWLSVMELKHGLSVNEINIERLDTTGLVNVRVLLESL